MPPLRIFVEIGDSKTFASAVDWPGWARSGVNEEAAIGTLLQYGPRYGAVIADRITRFAVPTAVDVVERVGGGSGTDFGAPNHRYAKDADPIGGSELTRHIAALRACWDAFDAAAGRASGRELRKGPRGGGRDVAKLIGHVLEAEVAYVKGLGGKPTLEGRSPATDLERIHEVFFTTLEGRLEGSIPATGPRDGLRWQPRFAIRYTAWHALDHAWEIEDRLPA